MKSMNRTQHDDVFHDDVFHDDVFHGILSSKRSFVRPETHYCGVGIIDAMRINCNKRFESRNIADNYGPVVGPNGETSKASA